LYLPHRFFRTFIWTFFRALLSSIWNLNDILQISANFWGLSNILKNQFCDSGRHKCLRLFYWVLKLDVCLNYILIFNLRYFLILNFFLFFQKFAFYPSEFMLILNFFHKILLSFYLWLFFEEIFWIFANMLPFRFNSWFEFLINLAWVFRYSIFDIFLCNL
jgi:hypothetical protein